MAGKPTQLASGSWRVQIYIGKDADGKPIRESVTASTKAEAVLLAAQREAQKEKGVTATKVPQNLTVGDAIDQYLRDNSDTLAPKTLLVYHKYRKNNFQPLMSVKLSALTNQLMQQEINRSARTLSPKSIRNIYGLVTASIRALIPEKTFDVNLPAPVKPEITIPDSDTIRRILDRVSGTMLELPCTVAATCGLRRGEICALDLTEDVDYEHNRIHVRHAMAEVSSGSYVIGKTKTYDSKRTVDAPAWVIQKLAQARASGYQWSSPTYITNAFAKITKSLGVKMRFHDFRHYYVSTLISVGAPDDYIMARTGHSTPTMIHTVYGHLMQDKDKAITEAMNAKMAAIAHESAHTEKFNEE